MYPVSCTNIHHDVTNLVKHRMVKKILNLCLRWLILGIYLFVAEVTFKVYKGRHVEVYIFPISVLMTYKDIFFNMLIRKHISKQYSIILSSQSAI